MLSYITIVPLDMISVGVVKPTSRPDDGAFGSQKQHRVGARGSKLPHQSPRLPMPSLALSLDQPSLGEEGT